jgi:hypothetical protein
MNILYKILIKLYLTQINYDNTTINKEIDYYINIIFKVIKTGISWKDLNEKLNYIIKNLLNGII